MPYSPSDMYLSRVSMELPRTVEGIADLLSTVEKDGPVQRVLVELGHPVVVWQWKSEPDQKESGVDQVVRTSKLKEYAPVDDQGDPIPLSAAEVVLGMLHELARQGRHPAFWAVGPNSDLDAWLPTRGQLRSLAGVQLIELEELPSERLVLGGSTREVNDPEDVDLCLSYVMEVSE